MKLINLILMMVCSVLSLQSAAEAYSPPEPVIADEYDWMQLTSGEWLKGEIKALYNQVIEFDSDELDLLELDWEDVAQIRSGKEYTVGLIATQSAIDSALSVISLSGNQEYQGKIVITQEDVVVIDPATEEKQQFNREDLLTIAPSSASEIDHWTAKLSLGFNIRGGNTDQFEYSSKVDVKRRTANSRFTVNYLGKYTKTENTNTVNNHRVNASWDVFVARQFYVTPIFYEYFRDPFLNIDYQNTVGIGAGYQIIDTSVTEWDVSTGIAYKHTTFESVEAGRSRTSGSPSFVLQTNYETEMNTDTDFFVSYGLNILNEDSGQYTHHALTGFEFELTSVFDFDVTFIWDRIEKPTRAADGSLPKQDDYQIVFGLGIDF